MFLYCRLRTYKTIKFLEYYLCSNGSVVLDLPQEALPRFRGRELAPCLQLETLSVILVSSSVPIGPIRRTKEDILRDGAWASYYDAMPKGLPVGIASLHGIHINAELSPLFLSVMPKIYQHFALSFLDEPYVVYHGTCKDSVKSIIKEGFQSTFGMLGHAIYTGSFWKAFRFATMKQDYTFRQGAVLRCYAFWPVVWVRNASSKKCQCKDCFSSTYNIPDHEGHWAKMADAVMVWPTWPVEKGHIKNEEYACKDASTLLIESFGHVECTTKLHEPFNRNLTLL